MALILRYFTKLTRLRLHTYCIENKGLGSNPTGAAECSVYIFLFLINNYIKNIYIINKHK